METETGPQRQRDRERQIERDTERQGEADRERRWGVGRERDNHHSAWRHLHIIRGKGPWGPPEHL